MSHDFTNAFYEDNGEPVPTVEPDIYFDDEPEDTTVADTLDRLMDFMDWAMGSKARMAALRIRLKGDRRAVADVAREYRVPTNKVYQALVEFNRRTSGEIPLGTDLVVINKQVTKTRRTNSTLVP